VASKCGWDEINGFRSLDEYEQSLERLNEQIRSGEARSIALDPNKRWGTAFDERWFQCSSNGEVWRLVAPDPPFRGIFKPLGR
jgi:hypothetical protein